MKKITDIKEGDLLTIDQAAKLLGVTKKTLYGWRAMSGTSPEKYPRSARLGGTVFFLKSDLIDRLNRQFNKAS